MKSGSTTVSGAERWARQILVLLLAVAVLLLLASCSNGSSVRIEPPNGAASISGEFITYVPVLTAWSIAPDAGALPDPALHLLSGHGGTSAVAMLEGYSQPAAQVYMSDPAAILREDGAYLLPFHFEGLSRGQYTVCLRSAEYPAGNLGYPVFELLGQQQPVSISASDLQVSGIRIENRISSGEQSFSGRILISGNPANSLIFYIHRAAEGQPRRIAYQLQPVAPAPARLFYRVDGIAAGAYSLSAPEELEELQAVRLNGIFSEDSPVFTLNGTAAAVEADLYEVSNALSNLAASNPDPLESGRITCTLRAGAEPDSSLDIFVEARDASSTAVNAIARRFVTPAQRRLDGSYELYLNPLRQGQYSVRAWLLQPDSNETPVLLGELAAPVELVAPSPTQYFEPGDPEPHYHQGVAQVQVELEISL